MMNKQFEKLKVLLEGKRILRIDPPGNATECICCFHMEDGSAFRLHATDLGYWMTEAKGFNGYQSLESLMIDYGYHMYDLMPSYHYDPPAPKISLLENNLEIESPDGKSFQIGLDKLSDRERLIMSTPKGMEHFGKASAMGEFWETMFSENYDCPPELCRKKP
jgi:hypothetical protein